MSGSRVSPPVSLPNLKFVLRGSSLFGVPSMGPQWLLSGVLSLSKIWSPYQTGAALLRMKWLSFSWVSLHCRTLELKSTGIRFGDLLSSSVLRFSFHPTTRRYIGLPSFLSPPSSHKGPCTFTI